MDQSKFLNVVRRYVWLFVAAAVVAGLTTFLVFNGRPRVFEAKTRLLVGPTIDSPSPDLNSLRIGSQLMQTYADLITTRPFLESINGKLDQKLNLETLAGMIETRQNTETRVLTIIVRSQDPREAVAIAGAAADSLIEFSPSQDNTTTLLRIQMANQSQQLEQIINNAETSIQRMEAELVALGSTSQRSPEDAQIALQQQNLLVGQISEERGRLSDALRTLATIYQVLSDTNTNQLQIIEPAGLASPVNQALPLRVAASALAGMLLVMSIVFAYEYFDNTIRVPGDFSRTVKVPLLSTIEKHQSLGESGLERVITYSQPQSPAANSYRTAVAKLLFLMERTTPYTLMLSSVGSRSGDDAAVAAANLGVAFAEAGNRVILVDAQLQNPVLTELFEASGKTGLSDLLTTRSSELKLVTVKEFPDVQLLPAGLTSGVRAGAMLNSAYMVKRVEDLQKEADIVLVAAPPIVGFAESLALASQVHGVVLVARYGEVQSSRINEVADGLAAMNVRLAGVIFEQNPSPFATRSKLNKLSPLPGAAGQESASPIDPGATGSVEKGNVP